MPWHSSCQGRGRLCPGLPPFHPVLFAQQLPGPHCWIQTWRLCLGIPWPGPLHRGQLEDPAQLALHQAQDLSHLQPWYPRTRSKAHKRARATQASSAASGIHKVFSPQCQPRPAPLPGNRYCSAPSLWGNSGRQSRCYLKRLPRSLPWPPSQVPPAHAQSPVLAAPTSPILSLPRCPRKGLLSYKHTPSTCAVSSTTWMESNLPSLSQIAHSLFTHAILCLFQNAPASCWRTAKARVQATLVSHPDAKLPVSALSALSPF